MRQACERFASAGSRQRRIAIYPPSSDETILTTSKRVERRHTRPFRERLWWFQTEGTSGIPDEERAECNRALALAHSFEAYALWGLRLASQRSICLPNSHFLGFDLAPAELEKGRRHTLKDGQSIKEPGIDIVMTMNPKTLRLPRHPLLGLNVKASKGSESSTLLWYSPRIRALGLNVHVGRWPVTNSGNTILHEVYRNAIQTDIGVKQLLTFMERNVSQFGEHILQQVVNGVDLARWRMLSSDQGEMERYIRMFPEEGESQDRLFGKVSQLCSLFEESGMQPTRRHYSAPRDVAQHPSPSTRPTNFQATSQTIYSISA